MRSKFELERYYYSKLTVSEVEGLVQIYRYILIFSLIQIFRSVFVDVDLQHNIKLNSNFKASYRFIGSYFVIYQHSFHENPS